MADKTDTKTTPAPLTDVERLADAILARTPADPSNLGLPEAKRRELTAPLQPQRYRMVACLDESGMRFRATVVESRVGPHGRITAIGHCEWPEGIYTHVSRGGLVPDGMPIFHDPATVYQPGMQVVSTALSALYKTWRMEQFVQPIFRRYVGRELREEYCDPKGEGLKTAWQMSSTDLQEPAGAHG